MRCKHRFEKFDIRERGGAQPKRKEAHTRPMHLLKHTKPRRGKQEKGCLSYHREGVPTNQYGGGKGFRPDPTVNTEGVRKGKCACGMQTRKKVGDDEHGCRWVVRRPSDCCGKGLGQPRGSVREMTPPPGEVLVHIQGLSDHVRVRRLAHRRRWKQIVRAAKAGCGAIFGRSGGSHLRRGGATGNFNSCWAQHKRGAS